MAAKYLTIVGQLQWLVTLGRFDIHAQVATMSRFRAAPRQGHMDRLKRIYSYAIRTKDYAIRFRTEKPDYSFLPDQDFDWTYSVYGPVFPTMFNDFVHYATLLTDVVQRETDNDDIDNDNWEDMEIEDDMENMVDIKFLFHIKSTKRMLFHRLSLSEAEV